MTVFDLVFLTALAASFTSLLVVVYFVLTGKAADARSMLLALVSGVSIYLGAVSAVSLLSPGRLISLNENMCSDDWCSDVAKATRKENRYDVELRVSSRARRVTQREKRIEVYIVDERGRRFRVTESERPPFNGAVEPGEAFTTLRRFELPPDARLLDLVVTHDAWPGLFVIGDPDSLLHPPTRVRLD